MSNYPDPDPLAAALAEADRERARAEAAEGLARSQAASLAELDRYAEELRCQVADLATDAHTLFRSKPYPPHGLRYVTERMNRLADTLARAAAGYAGARASDMTYPAIMDDLQAHGWTPRPDYEQGIDGEGRVAECNLPPIPITELFAEGGRTRGDRRSWRRGPQTLTLWFTGPYTLAYAHTSGYGRLHDTAEIRTLITTSPPSAVDRDGSAATRRRAVPFDATYAQVAEHLRAAGWGELTTHRCDEHGIRRAKGKGISAVWSRPSNPGFRVYAWGIGDEPAHVWYWAGPVTDMAELHQITRYR